jgi:hypothetical protein
VYGVVQHILCFVFCFVCLRLWSCVWCPPTHIVFCFLFCLSSSLVLCMVSSNTYCVVFFGLFVFVFFQTQHNMCWTTPYTRPKTKTNKTKTQHNICWTTPYTRPKTKTNKPKNTTQYGVVQHILCFVFYFVCLRLWSCVWCRPTHIVLCFLFCLSSFFFLCMVSSNIYCVVFFVLFVNTICVGDHHTQDQRRKQTKQINNTICVGRDHTQDKRRRQTNQKTQHNSVWCRPAHIVVCFLFCLSSSFVLCMVSSSTYCGVFFALFVFVFGLGCSGVQHILYCSFWFVCLLLLNEEQQNK